MKRIEAIVHSEKINELNEELKKIGNSGATIYDAKGRGHGEKPMVQSGRGTGKYTSEFSSRSCLSTVVDDGEVDKIVKQILFTLCCGCPGEGKIFISTIAESFDIAKQNRGNGALE